MKTIKLLLFACMALFFSSTSHAQLPATLQQRLQDTLEHMRNLYNFKGLSAAVSYKNMGTWKSAVGMADDNTPLATNMLIGIGSNTKTFVSAMMLKLYEDGLINLTDTIGTWLHNYPNINGAITIKQILNHTSGIYSYTNNTNLNDSIDVNINRIWTKEELLRDFVLGPSFAPGTAWEYSNSNYLVAGIIEEAVTGRPVYQLLRDSIINPNQLTHTFFPPYETATSPYASYWTYGSTGYDFWAIPVETYSIANSAGGIVSDAEDNVKFWKALCSGNIIRKSTLTGQMMQWYNAGSGTYYGLGMFKEHYLGNTVFSHGGTWVGQINSNLSDTVRDIYITVLSNQDSLENNYTETVVAALYKVLLTAPTDVQHIAVNTAAGSFFPNPAHDVLVCTAHTETPVSLTISSIDGRILQTEQFSAGTEIKTSISGLSTGIYIAILANSSNILSRQKIEVIR
ncbi:serine hydrolase [Chitinophagaceae bacterium MMS25-I14]